MRPDQQKEYLQAIAINLESAQAQADRHAQNTADTIAARNQQYDADYVSRDIQAEVAPEICRGRVMALQTARDFVGQCVPTNEIGVGAVVTMVTEELRDDGFSLERETKIVYNPNRTGPLSKIPGIPRFLAFNGELGRRILGKQASDKYFDYNGKAGSSMRAKILEVE